MNARPPTYRKPDEFSWRDGRIAFNGDLTSVLIVEGDRDTLPVYMPARQFARLAWEYLHWAKDQEFKRRAEAQAEENRRHG